MKIDLIHWICNTCQECNDPPKNNQDFFSDFTVFDSEKQYMRHLFFNVIIVRAHPIDNYSDFVLFICNELGDYLVLRQELLM